MDKKTNQILEQIKKLLMFQLMKSGATSEEIGKVIGLDSSTVRHLISFKKPKKDK